MIETEEQRRWWFATHPEFSHKRTGSQGHNKNDNQRVRPEDVDAYVDRALKYESGSVADLLRSIKRNFGTEGQTPKAHEELRLEWDTEAGGRLGRAGGRSGGRRGDRSGRRRLEPRDWFIIPEVQRRAMEEVEAELQRGGANNPKDYRLTWYSFSWSQGRHVAQRDSTFDPWQRDLEGRTNVDGCKVGRPRLIGRATQFNCITASRGIKAPSSK